MTKRDMLAFEYFKAFTTFEAKLKGNGYHNGGDSNTVNTEWDRVAKDYHLQLKAILDEQSKEVSYLMKRSPRKMTVINSTIRFIDLAQEINNERKLLRVLCTVRNNLYHGGKYSRGNLVGSERNMKLVEYATYVLKKIKV